MRIKNGFELRTICRENIVISHGVDNINFTKVISLNQSAAYLWRKIFKTEFTIDDMVIALCDEYEVDEVTARQDCANLLNQWIEVGFIEE